MSSKRKKKTDQIILNSNMLLFRKVLHLSRPWSIHLTFLWLDIVFGFVFLFFGFFERRSHSVVQARLTMYPGLAQNSQRSPSFAYQVLGLQSRGHHTEPGHCFNNEDIIIFRANEQCRVSWDFLRPKENKLLILLELPTFFLFYSGHVQIKAWN